MKIEQIIIDSVLLTEQTKIPVLFLSNPGLGKTTILKRYAQNKGYHLESLIGSRFSPEEISGYQVNTGADHLKHISPEWFNRIIEKKNKGITTLLFIDEISTCSEAVQGALLSLIFDRTIGSEKFLPEDTIIVSAANYAQNLPSSMNIMAPTLNRFILINLNEEYKALDMLDEFIDEPDQDAIRTYTPATLSSNFENLFKTNFKAAWKEIFLKYSDEQSSLGFLNIANRELDGIYSDSDNYVYNFISGRTLSYLCKVLFAYVKLGMDNTDLFSKVIDGLVGNGTCNFTDEKQISSYRSFTKKMMKSVINKKEDEPHNFIGLQHDIVKDIQSYLINIENTGFYQNENITQAVEILNDIKKEFTVSNIVEGLETPEQIACFTTKMESILEFQQYISQYPDSSNMSYELTRIAMDFYGLYCDIVNVKPNFHKTFGCSSSLFSRVVFLCKKEAGKTVYARAALRNVRPGEYPTLHLLSKTDGLIDATLSNCVHDSDNLTAVYWDNGFKTLKTDEYVKLFKRKTANTKK